MFDVTPSLPPPKNTHTHTHTQRGNHHLTSSRYTRVFRNKGRACDQWRHSTCFCLILAWLVGDVQASPHPCTSYLYKFQLSTCTSFSPPTVRVSVLYLYEFQSYTCTSFSPLPVQVSTLTFTTFLQSGTSLLKYVSLPIEL